MRSRIGIYSGTFDPVHPGHITFAQAAAQVCQLDEIVFLPERRPRGKHTVTDISHRIALIKLSAKSLDSFRVLRLASDQFTVKDTLPELRSIFGSERLTFLIGSDVVRTFSYRWPGLDMLLREVSFAIGLRANDSPEEIAGIMAGLEQEYKTSIRCTYVHTPANDFASSQIRNGTAGTSQLHPDTISYIRKHGLYPLSRVRGLPDLAPSFQAAKSRTRGTK